MPLSATVSSNLFIVLLAGAKYVSLFYCRLKQHGSDVEDPLRRTRKYILENGF